MKGRGAHQANDDMIDLGLHRVTIEEMRQWRRITATPLGRDLQMAQNRAADATIDDLDPDRIRDLQDRADRLFEQACREDDARQRGRIASSRVVSVRARPQVRSRRRRSVAARTRRSSRSSANDSDGDGRPRPSARVAPLFWTPALVVVGGA